MPEGAQDSTGAHVSAPQATGGPDDFGYTWDDSAPINWIDATTGTDTGMSGSSYGQATSPIPLPFTFKFYENTYSQVYIAASGYLAFTEATTWPSQGPIPSPAEPNNIVAPYWVPLNLASSGVTGRVFYASGGTIPNRYFVVQWNSVSHSFEGPHTFEVILHENGDIVFQYGTMTYSSNRYYCAAAGIENATGLDGLAYVRYCGRIQQDQKAVRFYRPAPSARVSIFPVYQGRFVRASETATFQVPIRNAGEFGTDTYDITASSTWPVSLYKADGITPLSDTDGDGVVDTGSVPQGATATIVAKVATPNTISMGEANNAAITARSSVDTTKSKTASLRTGIPAPFAQVFRDDADGAMSLYLSQPGGQSLKKTTGDWYYGYDMAVAEMPTSFAYFWSKGRSANSQYVYELEYTLLNHDGSTQRAVTRLTDHSGATVDTYDDAPAVAVAPNGRIGVLWYRYLYNSDNGTWNHNYNIFFAILDSSGNLIYGPANLTNNTVWGTWNDYGIPYFYDPRITATGDNRFVLAWERQQRESAGYLNDIYYAVRDANGGAVKGVTKFTNGVAGGAYFYSPALASLSGNRALLAYSGQNGVSYTVLDSAGNAVKGQTATGGYGNNPDTVQLSNGPILLAWLGWEANVRKVNFAVLDNATYNVAAGPTTLENPAAATGDGYVSVTADAAGHGILTWMDYESRNNLYYALVDGSGTVLTPPMIFYTSQAAKPRVETSYTGYGNTSYSDRTPPTSQAQSPEFAIGPFPVKWGGVDAGFGIASYNVQVRDGTGGTWNNWLVGTTAISATYTAVEVGHTYYFRSIATDYADNVETAIPANGDTSTTIAAYKVEGQVTNNRHQAVFNATVNAQPAGLNTATTNSTGDYALYFDSSGTYTLTANHSNFGALPPMYNVVVDTSLSGMDFVLPPTEEAVSNGGWETGHLDGWTLGPGVTASVEMTATHTGRYGVHLNASGGTLMFWPYITQTVAIPSGWSQPTLSFLYKTLQGGPDDALLAIVSSNDTLVTHTVSLTPGDWMHAWSDLSAFSGQTVTLSFGFQEQTPGQQLYLDEISVGDTKIGVYSIYLPLVMRQH